MIEGIGAFMDGANATEEARAAWTELTYVDPAELDDPDELDERERGYGPLAEDPPAPVENLECVVLWCKDQAHNHPENNPYNRTMAPIRVEWVDGVGKHHYVYADNALTAISLSQSLGVDTFVHNVLITAHDPGVRIIDVDLDTL